MIIRYGGSLVLWLLIVGSLKAVHLEGYVQPVGIAAGVIIIAALCKRRSGDTKPPPPKALPNNGYSLVMGVSGLLGALGLGTAMLLGRNSGELCFALGASCLGLSICAFIAGMMAAGYMPNLRGNGAWRDEQPGQFYAYIAMFSILGIAMLLVGVAGLRNLLGLGS